MVFRQLFELAYHSNGGFDYNTAYALPVWLRNFNYKLLTEAKKEEKEEMDKATGNKNKMDGNRKIIPQSKKEPPKNLDLNKYKNLIKR